MTRTGATMEVNGLTVTVHHPVMDEHRGASLAPGCEWPVYRVADYDNGQLPDNWERGEVNQSSYFVGIGSDRELWFDFNANHMNGYEVAVLVSVQRVNALTGKPVEITRLEQYSTVCPIHESPFGEGRFCKECGHTWPHQNYIAGPVQGGQFWIDGWRALDGKIRQFVFDLAENGTGVAQQILGSTRARGIGFAFYLSKNPKPVAQPAYRGPTELGMMSASKGGSFHGDEMLGLESLECFDEPQLLGAVTLGASHQSATRSAPTNRVGRAPRTTEVTFGREVDQTFHRDPNPLSHWQENPAGVIILNHADRAWVEEIVRSGPTVDRTAGGMGPLAGLKGVSA